jgi:hypothetical protein
MEGLYLGINLQSSGCQAAWFRPQDRTLHTIDFGEGVTQLPMVLGKVIGKNQWCIGTEALQGMKEGNVILVEKLMILAHKTGTLSIDGAKYKAEDLVKLFIARLLKKILKITKKDGIIQIAVTLEETQVGLTERIIQILEDIGIQRKSIKIINHTEGFLYYVLNQPQDIWRNLCCMFDLTRQGLDYYEFQKLRGSRPVPVLVKHQKLEDEVDLDVLKRDAGQKIMDKMLTSSAQSAFHKKVVTSVFLSGEGLDNPDWAKEFTSYICHGRKVFVAENIYAQGAAALAYDTATEGKYFPYLCLCEGRVMSTVSMEVFRKGSLCELVLVKAGTNWYEAKASVELLLENTEDIILTVETIGRKKPRKFKIPLDKFPERPPKTTRVEFTLAFLEDNYMMVLVRDEGFGEIYPSSKEEIRQYIRL